MKRQCYYIPPNQDRSKHGGFVPSLVIEDEPGHSPLLGDGQCSSPWIFGQSLEEAEKLCDELNLKRGVSHDDMVEIVSSSMFASAK